MERIKSIGQVTPQDRLLDGTICEQASRVIVGVHQNAVEIKPQAVRAHDRRHVAPLAELDEVGWVDERLVYRGAFALQTKCLIIAIANNQNQASRAIAHIEGSRVLAQLVPV